MKKNTIFLGVFLALALILSYVESLIPFFGGIPGFKLGLSNLVIVLALYLYGCREAFLLNLLRVLVAGFLFGNLYMILYSLAGALCSYFIMVLLKQFKIFSLITVSICGGVFHNIGQIIVAYFVIKTYGIFYYLPVLMIAGIFTGALNGLIASLVKPYLQRITQPDTIQNL